VSRHPAEWSSRALVAGLVLWLGSACASAQATGPANPPADGYPAEPEPPSGPVYSYPSRGQSAERQDRDRYECHEWAVRQTRFDPSVVTYRPAPEPPPRVVPVPPPGTSLLAGAITGAVIGAAVSGWKHQSDGAAWGAAAGALLGGIADVARVKQAQQIQSVYDSRARATSSGFYGREDGYRRALSACLQGRGYTVQ
jgi:hypothetical protein